MKKMLLTTVLALTAGAMAIGETAVAQQGGNSSYTKNSAGSSDRPVIQAPIGHRQPRASDVPSEQSGEPRRRGPRSQDQEYLPRMLGRPRDGRPA
jgi:hypothetical protein